MSAATGMPRLRALHASPDAPAVDVYVDGLPAITNLSYAQISDYAELSVGSHNVSVFPAGLGAQGSPVITVDVNLSAGQDYTAAAIGRLENIMALVLLDSTSMPGPNMAKARILHASPDAPAVDVGILGGPTLFRNIRFGQATPFEEVSSGLVTVDIRPSGGRESVMTIPDVSVEPGNAYTIVALGMLTGMPPFATLTIADRIRLPVPA